MMKPKYIIGKYTADIYRCQNCSEEWLQRPNAKKTNGSIKKIEKALPKTCTRCKDKDWTG